MGSNLWAHDTLAFSEFLDQVYFVERGTKCLFYLNKETFCTMAAQLCEMKSEATEVNHTGDLISPLTDRATEGPSLHHRTSFQVVARGVDQMESL